MTARELGRRMSSIEFSEWQAWFGFGCEPAGGRHDGETPAYLSGDDELYAKLTGMFGKGKR
jgi:hypothetical protein